MVSLPTPFHSLQPPGTPGTANTTWKDGDRMGESIAAQQLKIWPNMAASKHTMRDTCSECRCVAVEWCGISMHGTQAGHFQYKGVSENVVYTPKPNGFADHYPVFKWLFHWEYTLFSDKPIIKRCKMVCTKSMWGSPSDFSRGSTGLSSQIGIEQTFEPSSATKKTPFGAFCSGPNPWFLSITYHKMHIAFHV